MKMLRELIALMLEKQFPIFGFLLKFVKQKSEAKLAELDERKINKKETKP